MENRNHTLTTMSQEAQITERLKPLKLSDDLFPAYQVPDPETTSVRDQLLVEYLEVLDLYTSAQSKINEELKEGFIQLSRANYVSHSLGKPYGRDYWDERVKAIRGIKVGDEMSVEEIEHEVVMVEKKEVGVRNRKGNPKEVKKSSKKYNPINMFGVLVPLQLRQSQSHFIKSLGPMIDVINMRNKLDKLSKQIKELDDDYTKG